MKKIINVIKGTIQSERKIMIFNIIVLLIGVIFGSLFIDFVSKVDRKILINDVIKYISDIKKLSNSVYSINVFKDTILNNFIQLFIIFILGLSLIGIFIVVIMLFFKGFTLGLTLSTIIYKYSYKGIIFAFFYVFPFTVFNLLIYIYMSFFAIYSTIKFLKAFITKGRLEFKQFLGKYILSFLISIVLMIISVLCDSYLLPILLKIFTLSH